MMHPDSKSQLVPFCVLANFAFCMSFGYYLLLGMRRQKQLLLRLT